MDNFQKKIFEGTQTTPRKTKTNFSTYSITKLISTFIVSNIVSKHKFVCLQLLLKRNKIRDTSKIKTK
jgi:hypothetical protein